MLSLNYLVEMWDAALGPREVQLRKNTRLHMTHTLHAKGWRVRIKLLRTIFCHKCIEKIIRARNRDLRDAIR